jgi:hypothetical protein
MKFRKSLIAVMAALATANAASSAWAITNGQPDEGRHPWVGALVSYDPETGDKYLICSGTLIAPKVFLTAAHCLLDEPSDLYVSFDPFVGAPDVGPEVKLYHGVASGHPEFVDETAPGDTHDIAVVVLDDRVRGVSPANLPQRRALDRLDRNDLLGALPWGVVGYGREGYDSSEDAFYGGGSRFFGFSSFGALEDFKLNLTQVPPDGGTCRGDSGGPVFLGRTRTVVGIVSDGDPFCQATSVNYRTDTASARRFVKRFLR